MKIDIDSIVVKETHAEDEIGQWVKSHGLYCVPLYIPVFKFTLTIAYGSFEAFKSFMLKQFEHDVKHHSAQAMAVGFEDKEQTQWHWLNIQSCEWSAKDYGTLAHELHHATHFMLEEMGVTYDTAGEEVFAYMQGHLMELTVRAFFSLKRVLGRNKKRGNRI
jgi:hypothetical protein